MSTAYTSKYYEIILKIFEKPHFSFYRTGYVFHFSFYSHFSFLSSRPSVSGGALAVGTLTPFACVLLVSGFVALSF